MNLVNRAISKYRRMQKNRAEAREIKRQLIELSARKVRYLDIISKTRMRLEQLYEQCESALIDNPEFLKTGAVDFCRRLAREQTEDEMYLPCIAYIYFACRILRPKAAIETGVERGSSTYTILKTLEKDAHLYSFDLTPEIQERWNLGIAPVIPRDFYEKMLPQFHHYDGYSKDTMPSVLGRTIDFAFVGSDHRYESQSFETRNIWKFLRSGGICLVDRPDIEGNEYRAWNEFLRDFKPAWTILLPEGRVTDYQVRGYDKGIVPFTLPPTILSSLHRFRYL